jgi:hypothetical protein
MFSNLFPDDCPVQFRDENNAEKYQLQGGDYTFPAVAGSVI